MSDHSYIEAEDSKYKRVGCSVSVNYNMSVSSPENFKKLVLLLGYRPEDFWLCDISDSILVHNSRVILPINRQSGGRGGVVLVDNDVVLKKIRLWVNQSPTRSKEAILYPLYPKHPERVESLNHMKRVGCLTINWHGPRSIVRIAHLLPLAKRVVLTLHSPISSEVFDMLHSIEVLILNLGSLRSLDNFIVNPDGYWFRFAGKQLCITSSSSRTSNSYWRFSHVPTMERSVMIAFDGQVSFTTGLFDIVSYQNSKDYIPIGGPLIIIENKA